MRQESILLSREESIFNEIKKDNDPYPVSVEVHPTDICNQACDYCFHGGSGFGESRDPSKYLSIKQIKNFIGCISELGIKEYSISGGGEPFLSRNIKAYIIEAQLNKLNTRIVTNGNFIPTDLLENIVECVEIRFSVDTTNPDTYSLIRNVDRSFLETTLANINSVVKEKKKQRTDILIGASFITNSHNQGEIVQFADILLGKIGVDKVIYKYDIYGKCIPDDKKDGVEKSLSIVKSNWGDAVEIRTQLGTFNTGLPCVIPYFKVSVNPYGDLFSCCLGAQPKETDGYFLGNMANDLNNESTNAFENTWKASKQIRRVMLQKVKCRDCNYTDRLINQAFIQY